MQFSKLTSLFVLAAATAVQAVNVLVEVSGNPISAPTAGDVVPAGEPVTIVWNPTTEGEVTLVLRKGDSNALETLDTIAEDIDNTGTYTWTPSEDLVAGDDYAVEIRWGDDEDYSSNYSPKFVVDSDVTEASTTSSAASSTATETATETDESTTATETETSTETSTLVTSTTKSAGDNATSTRGPKPTDDGEVPEEGAAGKAGISALAVIAAAVALLA
jgi:hypothetical protein